MLHEVGTGQEISDVLGMAMSGRPTGSDRPWVMLNMVTSVDGAIEIGGGTTALSDADDRALFKALRAVPDAILVGAGTVRAEDYRPVTLDPERVEARVSAGLAQYPRLVIVTGSLDLDPTARVFSDPESMPIILTSSEVEPNRIEMFTGLAEVVPLPGNSTIEGQEIVNALAGYGVILCEGGPSLNGALFAADLVDEINWTIAPVMVSGESARMNVGPPLNPPTKLRLDRILQGDRSLFLRYIRA